MLVEGTNVNTPLFSTMLVTWFGFVGFVSCEYVIGKPSGSVAAIVIAVLVPSLFNECVDAGVVVNLGFS